MVCKECGDDLDWYEGRLFEGRCKGCHRTWEIENKLKGLCALIVRAPHETAMDDAIEALATVADRYWL
jgi:hypothetical protein